MKIRMLKYCRKPIEGRILILNVNRIVNINDADAISLIADGMAIELAKPATPKVDVAGIAEDKVESSEYVVSNESNIKNKANSEQLEIESVKNAENKMVNVSYKKRKKKRKDMKNDNI